MAESDLIPCNEPGPSLDPNTDTPPPFCREREFDQLGNPIKDSLRSPDGVDLSWISDNPSNDTGLGASALCDPMQKGHIINEQGMEPPNPNTIYRYAKSIRGTDEAVKDLFTDLVVLDTMGKAHNVPIIWGTQEKAVAFIMQENVRKDESLVVDRVRLPILAIHPSEYAFDQSRYVYHKAVDYLRTYQRDWKPGFTTREMRHERDTIFGVARGIPVNIGYTLYAWTMYEEDMNQILEQILPKFSPMAYIRVRGISWEIGVKLDSIRMNVNFEPGDQAIRVFKYEFGVTAETFVAQPIVRKKAVLKTRVEIVDSTQEDEIAEVLSRLEESVKDLEENA